MTIIPLLTVAELTELTMNEELLSYSSSKPQEALKLINQVSIRVRGKIDSEQFYDEDSDSYIIPEDLKLAGASLCESYFTYYIQEKNNNATKKLVSERIDDYSYTYSDSQSAYTFFGIPTDSNVIAVIEAYSGVIGKGFVRVNLH